MSNEKITLGMNLKRIRKELNFRQYEIAGDDVTRNLISLMENDKTPIYHNIANIVAKNMNKILLKRGQDIYIQAEDILNPERYDSRKIANDYIEKLKEHLENQNYEIESKKLIEIENFLNKWNYIDKKVKIYELLGDIYYHAKDSNREYYYYIKALEVSYENPNMKERYKLILKIVYNCIVTKKYSETIRLCEFALSTQEDVPDKYKGIFYYNLALAYYYQGDYNKALDEIIYAKFYVSYNDYREMKRILMLEAVCNSKIKNYDVAIRIYNKLLKMLDDNPEEICLINNNILQIYIEKNNRTKVIEYHNEILNLLPSMNKKSFYLPEILISVAKTYNYLNDYASYEKYLYEILYLSKELCNDSMFIESISLLLDLYIKAEEFDKILVVTQKFEDEITNLEMNNNFLIILKLLYNLIKQNNIKEAENLIKILLEKEGNKNEN